MDDQVKQIPPQRDRGGTWVTFGGEAYKVPPLSFGAIRAMQDKVAALSTAAGTPTPDQMDSVLDIVHAAIKRNYPALTREEVAEMVDLGNYQQVLGAVLKIAGFKEQERSEGEAQASTGTASTSP